MSYATAVADYNAAYQAYLLRLDVLRVEQDNLNRAWELEPPRGWTANVTQIKRISDNVVFYYAGLYTNNRPDDPQQIIYIRTDLNTNPIYGGDWSQYTTV
jgi:hypothetical protein